MNYNKGFTAAFYAYRIDPVTWRETERFEVTGGRITRSDEGLRHAADIDYKGYFPDLEQWVRIYMDTEQNGASAHEPVFTGLACAPDGSFDGVVETGALQCFSVLKAAEDVDLPRGYYVLAGTDGARAVLDLLDVIPAPVEAAVGSPSLQATIIAEDGENRLTMADKILTAINWRLRISGDGSVWIGPWSAEPVASFDALENDCVEPQIRYERNLFECPNVLRAVSDELTAIARDEDQDSILSVQNRGREVWETETDVNLGSGESIAEYAVRRLRELQTVLLTAEYTRRYRPEVMPGDVIRLTYPAQRLKGLFTVTDQDVSLGFAADTRESVSTYTGGSE